MHILAGEFKGRTLLSPPAGSDTRPMTSAAKKSLFDILQAYLPDATVLDLYCGTGTLGLEAMSRGARRCFFADLDRRVIVRLQRNIETLRLSPQCTVWQGDVTGRLARWLEGLDGAVDLAFVDPPFAHVREQSWQESCRRIFPPLAGRLSPDGLAVLRLPSDVEAGGELDPLVTRRTKEYGGMKVLLLGRPGGASQEAG